MPSVQFNNKQTAYVEKFLDVFVTHSIQMDCLPVELKARLYLINNMVKDNVGFDVAEWEVLRWTLECYFGAFGENDIDPLAEQAYAKITGHWPFDVPWYDRMIQVEKPLPYKGVRDYELGT